jgi:heme A synthase
MRFFGITLLVIGFLWIGWDVAVGFTDAQYEVWISQSQHLPPGDTLTRSQASAAMRELSLTLKDMHRFVIIPALLMLVGGLIAAFSQRRQKNETQVG